MTGGAGAIGTNLVRRLLAEGCRVAIFTIPGPDLVRLDDLKEKIEFIIGDLTDAKATKEAISHFQPELVYHLASTIWARSPAVNESRHMEVSALGTLNLLEALRETPCERFVFTGSAAVYGPGTLLKENAPIVPNTIFGACKAAASILIQTYARLYKLPTVEFRLFMPYGPWEHPDRLIPQAILSALAGRDFPMTTGVQTRDPVYIDDVVNAFILAAVKSVAPGSVFNIGAGKAIPVKDIVGKVFELLGTSAKPLLGKLPMRPDEIMEMSADTSAAREVLGWEPTVSLEEGLKKTVLWWQEHSNFVARIRST